MRKTAWSRGVTLVELLIAGAFTVTILLLVVILALSLYRAVPHYQANRELLRTANTALSRLGYELRSADQVVTAASTLGATTSVLVLSGQDDGGAAYTTTFRVDGGRLLVARNGAAPQALSSTRVSVTRFTAYHLTTDESQAVRVMLELAASTTNNVLVSRQFHNTIVLRGSYVE